MQEWIQQLWATRPDQRPTFAQICAAMESGIGWFDGTDPVKFHAYVKRIDELELAQAKKRPMTEPTWLQEVEASDGPVSADEVRLILEAAAKKDFDAQKFAAMMYLAGGPVKQSYLQAAQYAGESPDGVVRTLRLPGDDLGPYERGQILEGAKRFREASLCYKEAAERGIPESLWRWGMLLLHNDTGVHFVEGLRLIKRAAKEGVVDAIFELGNIHLTGDCVPLSEEKAIEYFERAFQLGHPDAALALAIFYHERLDFDQACSWYSEAVKSHPEVERQMHDLKKYG
jgi:tetratricopeptide (TPR) repeat protein